MSRFYCGRSRDTDRSFPHGRMEGRARSRKEPTVNNVRGDSKTFRNGAFDADKIMNKRAFVIAATGIRLAIPGPASRDKHNLPRRMLKRASIIFSCKLRNGEYASHVRAIISRYAETVKDNIVKIWLLCIWPRLSSQTSDCSWQIDTLSRPRIQSAVYEFHDVA